MPVVIDGTTGITAAAFDGAIDGADITAGNIPADRITNALGATGSAPMFACRAWVNFNGTGTVAIRASGNVSSITDNGVGDYTVNFTTAMPDANYSAVATSGSNSTAQICFFADEAAARTTSAIRLRSAFTNFTLTDAPHLSVAVFR